MEKSPEVQLYSGLFGRSGFRYVQTFLLFFGMTAAIFVRANVGIAVVAITSSNSTTDNFQWTFDEKQLILSTFYWGYIVTQVPGGYAAQRLGSKIVLLLSILISSLLAILTPISIEYGGWKAYCVIRILQGLSQGVMLPSTYDHLAKWSPKDERNLQGTLALSGYSCGLVFGMGISGVIAASSIKWPGIFYVSGAIGILWSVLWMIFGASSPATSRFITEKEKKFIESTQKEDNQHIGKVQSIPWMKIFTSPPFLALLFVSCCQSFGTFITSVEIPLYFDAILKLDIENNALFSSLSQVFTWIMAYVLLVAAQFIMKREILSLTALRKSFNLIAFVVPMVIFISLGFMDSSNTAIAVTLIIVIAGISATHEIAYWLNIVDLSPNYTAILFSIANVAATFVDLIAPLVVGFIIKEQEDSRERWQIVFAISAIIVPVGGMVFLFFGKTDAQPWNSAPKNDNDLEIS